MLPVQVDYWNLQEKKRSNLRNEELKAKELAIAQANLEVAQGTLAETIRHQTTTEKESGRHNLISEEQKGYELGNQNIDVNTRAKQADIAERKLGIDDRNASASMLRARGTYKSGLAAQSQAKTAKKRATDEAVRNAESRNVNQTTAKASTNKIDIERELLPYKKGEYILKGLTGGADAYGDIKKSQPKPKGGK